MASQESLSVKLGQLIIIEGADGVGKSTQLELICEHLELIGKTVVVYDFPLKSGNPIADLIGEFLKGRFGDVTPEFLALAFSLDRFNVREKIISDLAAGKSVICDRYVSSNIAFQGAKLSDLTRRSAVHDMLIWLEYELLNLPRPDIEIILLADERYFINGEHLERKPSQHRSYVGTAADFHESSRNLQVLVNNYYLNLQESPQLKKISIFDEARNRIDIQKMHERIWKKLDPCLQ